MSPWTKQRRPLTTVLSVDTILNAARRAAGEV